MATRSSSKQRVRVRTSQMMTGRTRTLFMKAPKTPTGPLSKRAHGSPMSPMSVPLTGEDSLGLWQINIDPAQTDNPDTFDCSEIVQWASGPAVRTGAGIADVTYDEPSSAPPLPSPSRSLRPLVTPNQ